MGNLLTETANERYTTNKSVALSVIPVCSKRNRSHSLDSSHHGIHCDIPGQPEGSFHMPALASPLLFDGVCLTKENGNIRLVPAEDGN